MRSQVIGLTIPTWAPAFYHSAACEVVSSGFVRNDAGCTRAEKTLAWRSSRRKGRCSFNAATDKGLAIGIHCTTGAYVKRMHGMGFTFGTMGSDMTNMVLGAKAEMAALRG